MDNYQLIYITQGRGWFHVTPEKRVALSGGSMLIIPPYTWHSYYPDKKTGWQEYWIGIRGAHIDSRYESGFFSCQKIVHTIGLHELIVGFYKEAIALAMEEKPGYQQVLAAIANSILAYTLFYDANFSDNKQEVDEKMDRARILMRERLLAGVTPEEVASMLNMSYSWFRKTFKAYTHVSPAHYITSLKLQEAKSLLLNNLLSIKEIAYRLHYENPASFSAIFKKYLGMTPSEYRRVCVVSLMSDEK